jgi:hypothetical protein
VLGYGIASVLFAVALLASGQMSAVTGTLAGQVVIEGFLRWKVSPAIRRLVTRALAMAPASLSFCSMAEGGGLLMRRPAFYPVPASTKQFNSLRARAVEGGVAIQYHPFVSDGVDAPDGIDVPR